MGLTAYKSVRLEDAGLIGLYTKDEKRWRGMAEHAYSYTSGFVKDTGEEVRPDDLIPVLVPALELDERLREYLAEKKLGQQYWFTWFGELIVDRLWEQLEQNGGGLK
jgi:hypothetical protein